MIIPEQYYWGVDIAIKKLRPTAKFTLLGMSFLEWEDPSELPPPDWDEIINQVEIDRLAAEKWLEENKE